MKTVSRALRERLEFRDPRVLREVMARPDLLDLRELPDLLDPKARQDLQDLPVKTDRPDLLEFRGLQVQQAQLQLWLDLQAQLEQDQQARQVLVELGLQVRQGPVSFRQAPRLRPLPQEATDG